MDEHTRAAHLGIETARNGEHGIANRFALESADIHPMQQDVVGVGGFVGFVGGLAGHLVGARKHHLADEAFQRPALFIFKMHGQRIEQFPMRRRLAEHSKIIHRGDDAAPKR